jgi:DNA-binding transcriptional ArsR family regulator
MTSEQGTSTGPSLQNASVDSAEFFGVLSNPLRQIIVTHLDECGESVSIEEMADELARRESGQQHAEIPDEQSEPYYLELYHRHVPKLVDAGLVERDEDDGTFSLVDECDGISKHVDQSTPD